MTTTKRQWLPCSAPDIPDGMILFDGECALCSWWVHFVIRRDVGRRFRFTSVQSRHGGAIARRFGIDPGAPETNAVYLEGRAYFKSDAALQVLAALPGVRWVLMFRLLPRCLRDRIYDLVARNRYRLFGRTCAMPDPAIAARVIEDEAAPG